MINININNIEFIVKSNFSVLEACKFAGILIPRFCYYENLSIAGNCRMCLVEINNSPKPVASCALPLIANMSIFINTPLVKKARENILELLLLNHPLDCPICDQGGECDLQDQTRLLGITNSRFFIKKRSVENKALNSIITSIMTRCIHCTRCVRYSTEILGTDFLGTLNRGGLLEIGSYIKKNLCSELSANLVDLCPVGALTSKIYSFKARPWELRIVESIDLMDGLGSNIYINFKETTVVRIIPKVNLGINGNLLTDKARFFFDSLKNQRLYKIYTKLNNQHKTISWSFIFKKIHILLYTDTKKLILVDSELDLESLCVLKNLTYKFNTYLKIRALSTILINENFIDINYNNKIINLDKKNAEIFIFSSNLKLENSILNSKIRLKFLSEDIKIFNFNCFYKLNYSSKFINLNINKFLLILEGKNLPASNILNLSKNIIFIIGESFYCRGFTFNLIGNLLMALKPSSIIINVKMLCNTSGLEFINIKPINTKTVTAAKNYFLINLKNNLYVYKYFQNLFLNVYWFATHGSEAALKSNSIIPITTGYEGENIFVNLEGRPQKTGLFSFNQEFVRSIKNCFELFLKKQTFNYIKFYINIIKTDKLFNINKIFKIYSTFFNNFLNLSSYPIKLPILELSVSNKLLSNSLTLIKIVKEN